MRILIVEDEPLVRQRLLRLCGELAGTRARFDAVADLDSAEDRLGRSVYDGLLLDLNLVGEDGFDLLRRAVVGRYHCVVVSAHRERALQAFEYGVLDFVPKPFSRERLDQALERLLDAGRYRSGQARYLGIWRAQGTALVELADVLWIRADGDYSELRLRDGRSDVPPRRRQRAFPTSSHRTSRQPFRHGVCKSNGTDHQSHPLQGVELCSGPRGS